LASKKKKKTKSKAVTALALAAAEADEFYADEIKIGKNAETAAERRITRGAAMVVWREENMAALLRDETGDVWGWSLRRY